MTVASAAGGAASHVLNVLRLSRFPIYQQLLLEEALLRNTQDNWVVINDGAFNPAIVMGISGKPAELIHVPQAAKAGIQVIKRFTGGGTVVVDEDTLFMTLIFQGESLPHVDRYPQPIMRWTEAFYSRAFDGLQYQGASFALRENDYVFGEHKFGGNAQAITGRRWLHHTSLLWDWKSERMGLLTQPKKAPVYRQGREHRSFLVPLWQVLAAQRTDTHAHTDTTQPTNSPQPTQTDSDATHTTQPSGTHTHTQQVDRPGTADMARMRQDMLHRLVGAAYALPGFHIQERSVEEASRALQGKGLVGTKLVDLSDHLQQAAAP